VKASVSHTAILLVSPLVALLSVSPGLSQPTIADLVTAARPGTTVRVPAAVYTEPTILINKSIRLIGEPGAVIRGAGDHELLVIDADSVTVSGFRLEHVEKTFLEDRAAVRVAEAADCRITDNVIDDAFFGIYLAKATRCEVSGNTMTATFENETSGGNAIHSWYSRGLTISGNRISGFRDGIYLEFTEDSAVLDNVSTENLRYGLHFMFSDRCRYERNVFTKNRAGVAVMYADGITLRGNEFRRAWGSSAYGLLLKEIKDGVVEGNLFEGNSIGLMLESADRLAFSDNTFRENGWAIKLMASATDNSFSRNRFLGNTFDVATNSRTTFSRFAGNYWDRYEGYDLDRDGVGDVAHRPVSLFSVLAERHESALYLYRSVLVDVLDAAERLLPVLTPTDLEDPRPLIHDPTSSSTSAPSVRGTAPNTEHRPLTGDHRPLTGDHRPQS
jgi:nitrous oxidase accessory protein